MYLSTRDFMLRRAPEETRRNDIISDFSPGFKRSVETGREIW